MMHTTAQASVLLQDMCKGFFYIDVWRTQLRSSLTLVHLSQSASKWLTSTLSASTMPWQQAHLCADNSQR